MLAGSNISFFFSCGFRPFFLGAAAWAVIGMSLWAALLSGQFSFTTPYGVIGWHAHEFIFGYVAAVITGFMLTAIPNWTGRAPVQGIILVVLFALWLSARVAIGFADVLGLVTAALIDSLFPLSVAIIALREIIAGQNRRNYKIVVILVLFAASNIWFHIEVVNRGFPLDSIRTALAIVVMLIMLIGGRIIPNFTHNWLVKQGIEARPVAFNAVDVLAFAFAAVSLASWLVLPRYVLSGALLAVAGVMHIVRLARWSGLQTVREPLVLVLHIGYLFVPIGFITVGCSVIWPQTVPAGTALHVWSTGAIGVMTLAVMTRAIRGHTGRALTAPPITQLIYVLVIVSALARLATIIAPGNTLALIHIASYAWVAAFAVFVVLYAPMLLVPQRSSDESMGNG